MSNSNPNTDTNIGHEIQRRHREAQQHLDRGRLAEAQQSCLRVLADDPKHADAHFLLGMIAVAGQRYKEAIGLLERAIVL
ncbi:MAG: tetratricopeptide repeat protein, partial [Gammaproteobacteria bacterium]|nr:tetratricopeptide repeat protein [Gammaproteobacteria bacterium]